MKWMEWLAAAPWEIAVVYLVINLAVFAMYGIDKYKAIHRRWRIPEVTLLGAAVFGVFGALGGMYRFRHKTKKPKFLITVWMIFGVELALTAWLLL